MAAWAGATAQGAGVALTRLIGAGANCLPVALLFLGMGALAIAVAPRAGTTVAYALVAAAFLWEVLGALFDAPEWLLAVSPFHDIGLVPAEPFEAVAAGVMLALALATAAAAVWAFGRRDLTAL